MSLPNSRDDALARGARRLWHGLLIAIVGAVALVGGVALVFATAFLGVAVVLTDLSFAVVGIALIA